MDRELKQFPEVVQRLRQDGAGAHGRPTRRRSAWSRPWSCSSRASEWRPGLTWDALIDEMDERAALPGHAEHLVDADPDAHRDAVDRHSQPARHQDLRRRPGDRSSGRRSRSRRRWRRSPARAAPSPSARRAASISTSRSTASAAARYGVRVADVNEVDAARRSAACASPRRSKGASATRCQRAVRARLPRRSRAARHASWSRRAAAPRCRCARWRRCTPGIGPPMIRSEDGRLVGYVFVDTGERPIPDYVEEARARRPRRSAPAARHARRVGGTVHLLRARQGPAASSSCR